MGNDIDPLAVKAESEARILAAGGKICDWLPWLDRTTPRAAEDICARTLVMHAMLQLAFRAPKTAIRAWLLTNGLLPALSKREQHILASAADLSDQESTDLWWYLEALWALVWVGGLIDDLPVASPVGDNLASLLPKLQVNEPASNFRSRFRLRGFAEVFAMLDFYYRAHWYARDGHLNRYATEPFDLEIVMERRKALEWVSDSTIEDWDDTPDHT